MKLEVEVEAAAAAEVAQTWVTAAVVVTAWLSADWWVEVPIKWKTDNSLTAFSIVVYIYSLCTLSY